VSINLMDSCNGPISDRPANNTVKITSSITISKNKSVIQYTIK